MKLNDLSKFVIAVVGSETAGMIGSIFTQPAISDWYSELNKSALTPPSWVFGPVWTVLFFIMGVAAFLIWRKGTTRQENRDALKIFGLQLALNALWSILFFGLRSPLFALIDIFILWGAIAWTIWAFYRISRPAAYLLMPYILWVSFAVYLNLSIVLLNPLGG